ncbi:MAG: UvrD-helicase domain-containing protein [Planctomycetes bacterium]|nr:UvrD-helicase domain-containing protein [Planctomycetota bacterium]
MATEVSELLADLTEPQCDAVRHRDGPLLVLAGPGSGKTTVVTRRIAHLIAHGVQPWQILALTFTNKAAGEMRERICALLGAGVDDYRAPTVATFHSFCARQLRRFAEFADLAPNYSIYDSADQRDAIKQSIVEAGLSSKNWTPGSVAAAISNAKNTLMDADAYAAEADDFYTRSIAKIYRIYERLLQTNDALDFDDLLMRMARMLRDSQEVRERFQERYQYLLIDEYQDTNHAQFVIAHSLASAHQNICVVGDPDQSIYGWRGADISNILEFEEHFPNAVVVALGQNFRSTGHIVDTAAGLIQNNRRRKHKRLHTELEDGAKPTVVMCRNEQHEAALVAEYLQRLRDDDDLPWKEMAVLYRINALSRVLEEALLAAQIPYVIARGTAFYDRKEVKDALAYLRLIVNPNDEVSLRRIINTPTRGIGKTTLTKVELFGYNQQLRLFEALGRVGEVTGLTTRAVGAIGRFVTLVEGWRRAAAGGSQSSLLESSSLGGLVERIIRESGLEAAYRDSKSEEDRERLENLAELISAATQFVAQPIDFDEDAQADTTLLGGLTAFLESVALISDADAIDPESGTVTLMTLHAAKGLEYAAVAMVGLEENLLPHIRAVGNEMELEEERRLCFVGITRAKRHLQLSRAAVRTHRGLREPTMESRFLTELPGESIVYSDQSDAVGYFDGDDDMQVARLDGETPCGEFPVGCVVRHPKFGLGRVEAVMPQVMGSKARVEFPTVGTKTLILEYAKLERVG